MNGRPLPAELLADIFRSIHLKGIYNSGQEWNESIALLTISKCANKFARPLYWKKKKLLLKTMANVDEYLARMEQMLFRVENWTLERHNNDEPRRRAIAEEHRKQIRAARAWDSWIFQYHYKVLIWNMRREGRRI